MRYLNLLRANLLSDTVGALKIPVTTGLLVLLSGAAHGNKLASLVQALDANEWADEKLLARTIRETLKKVKDYAEAKLDLEH